MFLLLKREGRMREFVLEDRMKNRGRKRYCTWLVIGILALIALVPFRAQDVWADQLKPEALVLKHLDSLATSDVRATVRNRMIVGDCRFSYHARGTGAGTGKAV